MVLRNGSGYLFGRFRIHRREKARFLNRSSESRWLLERIDVALIPAPKVLRLRKGWGRERSRREGSETAEIDARSQKRKGAGTDMTGPVSYAGLRLLSGYFDRGQQTALLADIQQVFAAAPLFTPRMPKSGRPFSVQMSNCGVLGWISDETGYRYAPVHPETGRPWPALPPRLAALWDEVASYRHPPEACLINFYGATAK